jgi:hypothetical protein
MAAPYRACIRSRSLMAALPEIVDDLFDLLNVEVLIELAIDLDCGCGRTRTETLKFDRRKQSIWCDFSQIHIELPFNAGLNVV